MIKNKDNPFNFLNSAKNEEREILVRLNNENKDVIMGRLLLFDIYTNLELDNAKLIVNKKKEELGKISLKGHNILYLSYTKNVNKKT